MDMTVLEWLVGGFFGAVALVLMDRRSSTLERAVAFVVAGLLVAIVI